MLSLLKLSQDKAKIIQSSDAEHSTVNNKKGFVLDFFVTKSSRNSSKVACLNSSLLMHQMLSVDNHSWNIVALQFIFNSSES